MSLGLVYHYYDNKEKIFGELVTHALDRMLEACYWLEKQPLTASEKINMAIEGLFNLLEQSPENAYYYLLLAQVDLSEASPVEIREQLRQKAPIPQEVMERIFIQGQTEGSVKPFPTGELALLFWTTLKGLALHKAIHGPDFKLPTRAIISGIFLK